MLKKVNKIYKRLKIRTFSPRRARQPDARIPARGKRKRQVKKSISLLKNPKNSKSYIINNGILQDLLKLLKYIII
jgi:hypothetical protein